MTMRFKGGMQKKARAETITELLECMPRHRMRFQGFAQKQRGHPAPPGTKGMIRPVRKWALYGLFQ